MMEFSCFSNSPNGPTTHTHTHSQCKDSNSNCLLLSLDPSSCKCTFLCFSIDFFVLHKFSFVVFTHSTQRKWERERKEERDGEWSCKACYVFNLSTICKRCTIQGLQLSLVPPFLSLSLPPFLYPSTYKVYSFIYGFTCCLWEGTAWTYL